MKSENENKQVVSKRAYAKAQMKDAYERILSDSSSVTDEELSKIILSYLNPDFLIEEKEFSETVAMKGNILYSLLVSTDETNSMVSFFKALKEVSEISEDRKKYDILWGNYDSAGAFFRDYIGRELSESLCVAFLNQKNTLIKLEKFSIGKTDSVSIGTERIIKIAEECNACKVLIAHNHPSGYLGFSKEDWMSTKNLLSVLSAMKISLVEHFAVSSEGYVGLLAQFNQDNSPLRNK